jgi:hypothetical protein
MGSGSANIRGYALGTLCFILAMGVLVSCDPWTYNDPFRGLTKISSTPVPGAAATLEVWHAGAIEEGYEPLVFALRDSSHPDSFIGDAHIYLKPVTGMSGIVEQGAPAEDPPEATYNSQFLGAVVFTMAGDWRLGIHVHNHLVDKEGDVLIPIAVQSANPSQVKTLTTKDSSLLVVSWARRKVTPVKGMNDIEFTIHHAVNLLTYEADSSYTMGITTEMPSMGHGSDGNIDPVHVASGHYKGKVNFTMPGDWRVHVQLRKNGTDAAAPFYFDVKVN